MANVLKNIFDPGVDQISQNYIIESWHVSQSVDAFTGAKAYDITLSGSYILTGSQYVTGSISASGGTNTIGFYGTSSWAVSSSKAISSSFASTSSYNTTSSFALTSSFSTTASYYAYGTNALSVGAFSDRTTQTITQNTSASLTFNTTDITDGVSISTPTSRLLVSKTGTYNFQFSVQIALSSGANGNAYLWLRKNGVNQTYTNTANTYQTTYTNTANTFNQTYTNTANTAMKAYVDSSNTAMKVYVDSTVTSTISILVRYFELALDALSANALLPAKPTSAIN